MHIRVRMAAILGILMLATVAAEAQIDARLLRQPDVSATEIAFVYGGDIWIVDKEGGVANRLSTPKGEESFPRFSPDGASIAFTGNYDGNSDIYVMPVGGGLPTRLTHHPDPDRMLDWYPDGESVLYATMMTSEKRSFNKLYRIPATGGLPEVLPGPVRRVRHHLAGWAPPSPTCRCRAPSGPGSGTVAAGRPKFGSSGLMTTRREISP